MPKLDRVSDTKVQEAAKAIAEAIGDRATQLGWVPESQWFMEKCRRAALDAAAVFERHD